MRRLSLASLWLILLAAAACGCSDDSSGNDINEPEIRSQEDVRRFFEAVMPELVEVFTELASQQSAASASLKQSGSTIPCPEGGSVEIDTTTGVASLVNCTVRGIVINAMLLLSIEPTGPSSYQATFSGTLVVTGTFVGTIEVTQAVLRWTDPATEENTSWEVTVLLEGNIVTVTSADPGGNGGDVNCPSNAGVARFVFTPFDPESDPFTVDTCAFFECQDVIPGSGCALQVFDIAGSDRFFQFLTRDVPFVVDINFCFGFDFVIDEPGAPGPGEGRGLASSFANLTGRQFGEESTTPFAVGEYGYRDDQTGGSLGTFEFFETGFIGSEIPTRTCQ